MLCASAWQIVGTDMFVIKRETYLLVSDYYSKFQFVYVIPSPVSSTVVIAKIKSLFTEQGVPQSVISDNGGHFSFDAFRRSVTSGASTTCHQAHTTLSKMASLNRETHFEESWAPIRRPDDPTCAQGNTNQYPHPLEQNCLWEKSGIELTCRNTGCRWQTM